VTVIRVYTAANALMRSTDSDVSVRTATQENAVRVRFTSPYMSVVFHQSSMYCLLLARLHIVWEGQTIDALWRLSSSSVTLHGAIIRLEAASPTQAKR